MRLDIIVDSRGRHKRGGGSSRDFGNRPSRYDTVYAICTDLKLGYDMSDIDIDKFGKRGQV